MFQTLDLKYTCIHLYYEVCVSVFQYINFKYTLYVCYKISIYICMYFFAFFQNIECIRNMKILWVCVYMDSPESCPVQGAGILRCLERGILLQMFVEQVQIWWIHSGSCKVPCTNVKDDADQSEVELSQSLSELYHRKSSEISAGAGNNCFTHTHMLFFWEVFFFLFPPKFLQYNKQNVKIEGV